MVYTHVSNIYAMIYKNTKSHLPTVEFKITKQNINEHTCNRCVLFNHKVVKRKSHKCSQKGMHFRLVNRLSHIRVLSLLHAFAIQSSLYDKTIFSCVSLLRLDLFLI